MATQTAPRLPSRLRPGLDCTYSAQASRWQGRRATPHRIERVLLPYTRCTAGGHLCMARVFHRAALGGGGEALLALLDARRAGHLRWTARPAAPDAPPPAPVAAAIPASQHYGAMLAEARILAGAEEVARRVRECIGRLEAEAEAARLRVDECLGVGVAMVAAECDGRRTAYLHAARLLRGVLHP